MTKLNSDELLKIASERRKKTAEELGYSLNTETRIDKIKEIL